MAPRLELHSLLKTFCPNVYFQPPANVQMQYPCIVYQRDISSVKFADNVPYDRVLRYQVTVIDKNPDSDIPDKVASLSRSLLNRFFVADNLNHDVYTLYF